MKKKINEELKINKEKTTIDRLREAKRKYPEKFGHLPIGNHCMEDYIDSETLERIEKKLKESIERHKNSKKL